MKNSEKYLSATVICRLTFYMFIAYIFMVYFCTILEVNKQETLLPQTDRAMRYVSQNLVNFRNKLYNKATTNLSNGVKGLHLIDL